MVTINKIGSTFFVSGSTIEGAAYARHFAQQPMQDFDFMLVEGAITSEKCLVKLNAKGFVQVKYDDKYIQQFSKTSFSTKQNQDGILCINGYKMKEKYCGADSVSFLPTSMLISTGRTEIDSASAEVKFESHSTNLSLGEQFENTLNSIRRIKSQENIEFLQPKYILACNTFKKSMSQYALPLVSTIADVNNFNLLTCQDIISLTFPVYNIQMPQVNKNRLNVLLEFYEKYKHIGDTSLLEGYFQYVDLCLDNEADFVPALELSFWPDDMQLFLDRIKNSRPALYQMIIETSSMHLIPKWSTKTSIVDQELEFRYSFSAIERLLAMKRTDIEKTLNGVARSIYCKYLKKQPSYEDPKKPLIPSYFIKTTVLWMCESIDLNDEFSNIDNNRTIALALGKKWLEYVIQLLSNGECKHYFINGMNLLESCSTESLAQTINILQNQVNLEENTQIEIFTDKNELLNQQRPTIENWLGNLKVKEILDAVNEYKLLKENWLCPSTDISDDGDAICCIQILNQLRTLDGNNLQNWRTFKQLFLDVDQTNWLFPIWSEQVEYCSPCDFTDGLLALSTVLNSIEQVMNNSEFNGTIKENINQHEFTGVQNILNDLIAPSNMINNGLMTSWLPMFTSSIFNTLPAGNTSSNARSIVDAHPNGPLDNLLQGSSLPSVFDSSMRQPFLQASQHVSNNFLDLLTNAPNDEMTLNELIKYYDKPQKIKPIISYTTNSSLINKEEFTLIVFDPFFDSTTIDEDMYRSINDYVLFYTDKSHLLASIQTITEEKLIIIIFDTSLDNKFVSQLQNLNQIDSIFIYCLEQIEINNYSKIINIYTDKIILFEQVQMRIYTQQSTIKFSCCHSQDIIPIYRKLSKEISLFLWNLLLKDLLMINSTIDKSLLLQKSREYYFRNSIEMENIKQFEKTYEPINAYEWYSKNCFISKQLKKALNTADIEQLKLFAFFIHDLYENMKFIDKLHRELIISIDQCEMLLKNIGNLITFSDFLFLNSSSNESKFCKNEREVMVKFEVLGVDSIDLNTKFKLDSFEFDENLKIWIARLIITNDGIHIAQDYLIRKQETMERMTLPIIMGELLGIFNDLSKTKTYFENLQNEDDGLIYYNYGYIHYLKGEYDLALDNFQISYELMISDERIKDSAFVLHGIGYVYDMTKDFQKAYNNHNEVLKIRQIYYPENDVYIGMSLYNIGRTLVNMNDDNQALIYHKKALDIWEQVLPCNDPFIAQSVHSHGVVYFNNQDYLQASEYYTRALQLYELATPRDDHGILMIENALENIKYLNSRQ